jgi:DNA-binding CsgD family transcriptional regulator
VNVGIEHRPDAVSGDTDPREALPGRSGARGKASASAAAVPALIFGLIALVAGADLTSDILRGKLGLHVWLEVVGIALALAGLGLMWRILNRYRRAARDLSVALDGTRIDLARWREQASQLLDGLSAVIDQQFRGWDLSPAEREVALLLLKGLSLKEIAAVRQSSEPTVRQQAQAVYRKAELTGRAELAAFFLEDLLEPRASASAGKLRAVGGEERARA